MERVGSGGAVPEEESCEAAKVAEESVGGAEEAEEADPLEVGALLVAPVVPAEDAAADVGAFVAVAEDAGAADEAEAADVGPGAGAGAGLLPTG